MKRKAIVVSLMLILVAGLIALASSWHKHFDASEDLKFTSCENHVDSNIDMACDMVDMNNENIQKALCKFGLTVDDLQDNYREKIVNIATERVGMYDEDGKNKL